MLLQFIHVSCNIATRKDSTENGWMQSFDTPLEYFGKLREGGNQFYLNAGRSQGVSGAAGREYGYTALLQLSANSETPSRLAALIIARIRCPFFALSLTRRKPNP